ncbi:MAG: mnmE [Halothiobacillaceae bacterium]|nr:MAG: mnmE [Halothiobacillaceae bacterium]
MSSTTTETIVAITTPPGRGGVGIVRVSGPQSATIARQMLGGQLPLPRRAEYRPFYGAEGELLDEGIVLFFPNPHSFTGEDVLELQGHGGPVVLDLLVARTMQLGARLARPGEFSERAFMNGKLDLVQAEAIADLIDSASTTAARAALRSLRGDFSTRIHTFTEALITLRIYIESAIDFPEEEIDFLAEGDVLRRTHGLLEQLELIAASARQGTLLREGMTVVIAGRPNAGKSSLLNRLAAREAAIVTAIPGTTRDLLREQILIDGLPLHIIDTAGLRDTHDIIEQQGVNRALQEISSADRVLLVVDDSDDVAEQFKDLLERLPPGLTFSVIRNKIDLSRRPAGISQGELGPEIALSANTGEGLELLREHLKACVGYTTAGEGGFIARRRHLDALQRTRELITHGITQLAEQRAGELLAEDLRQAQQALAEITGEFTSDDLLGKIFASFCIGK